MKVGGTHPIVVQSMTNTDTADVAATVAQVRALHEAGSELVRVTVNNEAAAAAVPHIVDQVQVPIIGDFHYNGHLLLTKYPQCAAALAKYRINPGNVGAKRRDEHFRAIIEVAIANGKPVRIGVNWGSLDQQLLTELMDANARRSQPRDARVVTLDAIVESATRSAQLAEECGLPHDRIILSAKVSGVQDLVAAYRDLARRSDFPLHLGLTEAGMGMKGIVASTAGLSILLRRASAAPIPVSLTPSPAATADEVRGSAGTAVARPAELQPRGHGVSGVRAHHLELLPGNGPGDSRVPAGAHAGVARALSRGGRPARSRDGVRGEWTGRVQARRYRDLAPGHG